MLFLGLKGENEGETSGYMFTSENNESAIYISRLNPLIAGNGSKVLFYKGKIK